MKYAQMMDIKDHIPKALILLALELSSSESFSSLELFGFELGYLVSSTWRVRFCRCHLLR